MKKIVILFCLTPSIAFAVAPATECPAGYVAITERFMLVRTTCPTSFSPAGVAESCLVSNPAGSCIMYAPVGVSYTDASGTYEFTEACPLY